MRRDSTPAFETRQDLFAPGLLGVALLALLLRLYRLDQDSLWFDEIEQVLVAQQSWWQALLGSAQHQGSAPLDYLVTHVAQQPGHSELILRLPAVIWGIAAVVSLALLGRQLYNPLVGLLSALLLACAPLHVFYSQEVRFYSLATLMALLSCYTLVVALKASNSTRRWLVYGAVQLLGLYTHYYLLLVALAQGLWLCLAVFQGLHQRRALLLFLTSSGCATLLFLPWVYYDNIVVGRGVIGISADFAPPGWDFYLAAYHFPGYPGSHAVRLVGLALVGLALASLVPALRRAPGQRVSLLPGLVMLVGLPGGFALNYLGSYWFRERQLLIWLPFLLLAASAGLYRLVAAAATRARHWSVPAGLALVGLLCYAWVVGLALARIYREQLRDDWRGVGQHLLVNIEPGDLVLAHTPAALAYYMAGHQAEMQSFDFQMPYSEVEPWIRGLAQKHRRIWIVIRGDPDVGLVAWIKQQQLPASKFTLLTIYRFEPAAPSLSSGPERLNQAWGAQAAPWPAP